MLILSEGLLIYLTAEEVGSLAEDLARPISFQRWVLDLASPGLLRIIQRQLQQPLEKADAPLKFGPRRAGNWPGGSSRVKSTFIIVLEEAVSSPTRAGRALMRAPWRRLGPG